MTRSAGLADSVLILALALTLFAASRDANADEALIAVATNFADTANRLADRFERDTGHRLTFARASTGALYAQITQGAPFDALLAADSATPMRLESDGAGVSGTRFLYAIGRLVLWSADVDRIGTDGRAALTDSRLRHVALANPELAPYGVAARQTLERLGLWAALEPRIAMGQNVGQTQAMIATGAAAVGFVALAGLVDLAPEAAGSRWVVPQTLYEPIQQEAILLQPGRDNEAARGFLAFLRSEDARAVIRERGYGIDAEAGSTR